MTADRRCPRSLDEVDLFDPATQQDWCPTYDLLRAEAPVWRVPGTSTFVLTRDDDIAHVLRRTDLFGRGGAADAPARSIPDRVAAVYRERGWPRMTWLATEPPVHRKYRDLVDHFFSVAGAERRRPLITAIVHDLLDAMVPLGRADFLTVFATPLPVRVITGMMGFDDAEIPQLKAWSEAWVLPVRGNLTEDEEVYAGEQGVAFQQHIFATMEAKRARPDDSVISHLVNDARFDGERPLRDEEVISIVDHLYIGGNETTAAGNRDPVAFPDPTTLDVDRVNAHRHVAFSLGETHCPGAGLSRLEQTIAFEVSAGPTGRWPLVSDAGVGSSRGGGRRANSTWSDAPSTAGRCRRDRNPMSATSANPPTHMTNATCRRVGQMTASRTARSTTTTARRLATMRGRGTGNAANTLPDNSTAASTPATAARRCRPPARSTSAHPTNRSPPGGAPDSSAPSEGRTAPSTTSMAAATTPRPSQHAAADAIRHGNRDRSQPIASRENPGPR